MSDGPNEGTIATNRKLTENVVTLLERVTEFSMES